MALSQFSSDRSLGTPGVYLALNCSSKSAGGIGGLVPSLLKPLFSLEHRAPRQAMALLASVAYGRAVFQGCFSTTQRALFGHLI